jgi:anti-sigma regulatory factor (Ser/Thr protein kinase)
MAANPAGASVCPVGPEPGTRWLRVFAGVPAQVAEARRFVSFLLAGCPARDALVSCVSELAANAIIHTASGDGGFFSVEVACPRTGVARVSVTDAGGPTEPRAGGPVSDEPDDVDLLPVSGLGLALVAARASQWGFSDAGAGRTVWAEASWPVAVVSDGLAAPWQSRRTGVRGWRGGDGAA